MRPATNYATWVLGSGIVWEETRYTDLHDHTESRSGLNANDLDKRAEQLGDVHVLPHWPFSAALGSRPRHAWLNCHAPWSMRHRKEWRMRR